MKIKIAINGFGRIGRNAFKIAQANPQLEIVAINDLTEPATLAYLLKHDSNYGTYGKAVSSDDNHIIVEGEKVMVTAEKEPANLPWKELDVQVVIESTGRFTHPEDAAKHLKAGAQRVVISAPEKGGGKHDTFVIGANEHKLTGSHNVVSN